MKRSWGPDNGISIEVLNLDSSTHGKLMRAGLTAVGSLEALGEEGLTKVGLTSAEIDEVLSRVAEALRPVKAEVAKNERRYKLGLEVGALLMLALLSCAFCLLLILPTILAAGFIACLAAAFGLMYLGEGSESNSDFKIWLGIATIGCSTIAVLGVILWLSARQPI